MRTTKLSVLKHRQGISIPGDTVSLNRSPPRVSQQRPKVQMFTTKRLTVLFRCQVSKLILAMSKPSKNTRCQANLMRKRTPL